MSVTPTIREHQDACPNASEHTYGPVGYVAWHKWAKDMMRTHTQHRCPGCGFWLIYRPRVKEAAS